MRLKRYLKTEEGIILTPLIDMIFLVVIFFMINASMAINPSISVNLPDAFSGKSVLEKQIVVTITDAGDIYIGKERVTLSKLPMIVKERMQKSKRRAVFLQIDGDVRYRYVIKVIDILRLSGISQLSLVTTKKSIDE